MTDERCPECGGEVEHVSPLYVDGRPLLRCAECGARMVDDAVEPSFKGLAPLRGTP